MNLERFDVVVVLFSLHVKHLKGKRRHRGGPPCFFVFALHECYPPVSLGFCRRIARDMHVVLNCKVSVQLASQVFFISPADT